MIAIGVVDAVLSRHFRNGIVLIHNIVVHRNRSSFRYVVWHASFVYMAFDCCYARGNLLFYKANPTSSSCADARNRCDLMVGFRASGIGLYHKPGN